jgi:hypothetical protein
MNNNQTSTKSTNNTDTATIEHKVTGNLGKAVLLRKENGERIASLTFSSGKKLTVGADQINIRAMGCDTVATALDKVCNSTGRVSLYNVNTFHGPKGVTRIYSATTKGNETGYGLFLKRGKKALSFALSRVDLSTMKASSLDDAARKAAFTGRIALTAEAAAA